MPRNKNRNGGNFSTNEIILVWRKATIISGSDSNIVRKDVCGHLIRFSEYGNTNSSYGWEIDHIKPVSKGGSDDLSNLQPLYWETNRDKADIYPWRCGMR